MSEKQLTSCPDLSILQKVCKGTSFESDNPAECLRLIIDDAVHYFETVHWLRGDSVRVLNLMAQSYLRENGYREYYCKQVSDLIQSITHNIIALMDEHDLIRVIMELDTEV